MDSPKLLQKIKDEVEAEKKVFSEEGVENTNSSCYCSDHHDAAH